MRSNRPVLKIVLLVWVIFSILYVGYTQYNYFRKFVADSAYQKGLSDAVTQIIQHAQKCEAFPISIDNQGVQLVNVECLKQQDTTVDTANN